MATPGSYYLNGPTLSTSTSVFTDNTLTTLAADGFYSDGTIVRQQVGGILLPASTCESCEPICLQYTAIAEDGPGTVFYDDCDEVPQTLELLEGEEYTFCALSNTVVPSEGIIIIEVGVCVVQCQTFSAESPEFSGGGTVEYTDCNGFTVTESVPDGGFIEFCSSDNPGDITTTGAVTLSLISTTCTL